MDQKIVELRSANPNSQLLLKFNEFRVNVIIPWMEDFYLDRKEMDTLEDEELKNLILEWITTINKVFKK